MVKAWLSMIGSKVAETGKEGEKKAGPGEKTNESSNKEAILPSDP
jgi:hypothetical protein